MRDGNNAPKTPPPPTTILAPHLCLVLVHHLNRSRHRVEFFLIAVAFARLLLGHAGIFRGGRCTCRDTAPRDGSR
jgi:hypothetical protein